MAITCICGLPGEGKTLYAVWLIARLVERGRTVATNINLTPKHPAYSKVYRIGTDEYPIVSPKGCFFNHFKGGVTYIIDEADVYFDAADHAKIVTQVRLYFKQHRKRKDDVVLIVQYPANLYVRIRRLVNEWVWCCNDGGAMGPLSWGWVMRVLPRQFWRYRRSSYAGPNMLPSELLRTSYFTYAEAQEIYGWYETEQLIGDCDFHR